MQQKIERTMQSESKKTLWPRFGRGRLYQGLGEALPITSTASASKAAPRGMLATPTAAREE